MATPQQVEQWLLQAERDLNAAEVQASGIRENHRRYWLQQSYEKTIKAWGLLKWRHNADDEGQDERGPNPPRVIPSEPLD